MDSHTQISHLEYTQNKVEVVKGALRKNLEDALQRGELLSKIEEGSDELVAGARKFEKQADAVRCKFLKQNIKTVICCVSVIVVIVLILALSLHK